MSSIDELIRELDLAEQLVAEFSGGYSEDFMSAEEFHKALKISIEKLKGGDFSVINELWFWFAPTCSWDDFVGMEGLDLGNSIHARLSSLKKSNT